MSEMASGILAIDPDPLFYILGCGTLRDERAYYHGHGSRVSYLTTYDRFFSEVNHDAFDVVIHNTYLFASYHRPEIYPLDTNNQSVIMDSRWQNLKSFKILYDGESFTQMEFYRRIAHKYDGVITYNREYKDFCDSINVPCHLSYICCPSVLDDFGLERNVAVSYSGSCLDIAYRKEIGDVLRELPDKYPVVIQSGAFAGLPVEDFVNLLNRSKIHQCTHSAASGEKYPMHVKSREGKALLCGALPITENFPESDGYLAPGKEKVVFDDLDELAEKIIYYLEHDDERQAIVAAGKKRIRENFTCDVLYQNAFRQFGLL